MSAIAHSAVSAQAFQVLASAHGVGAGKKTKKQSLI